MLSSPCFCCWGGPPPPGWRITAQDPRPDVVCAGAAGFGGLPPRHSVAGNIRRSGRVWGGVRNNTDSPRPPISYSVEARAGSRSAVRPGAPWTGPLPFRSSAGAALHRSRGGVHARSDQQARTGDARVDKTFGSNPAREHLELVAAVMQTAASDWAATRLAVAIERVAEALLAEEESGTNVRRGSRTIKLGPARWLPSKHRRPALPPPTFPHPFDTSPRANSSHCPV